VSGSRDHRGHGPGEALLMASKKYRAIRFRVSGKSPFPTDMLRYDACYPVDESDSAAIERANNEERSGGERFTVNLKSEHEATVRHGPTVDRWERKGDIVPGMQRPDR